VKNSAHDSGSGVPLHVGIVVVVIVVDVPVMVVVVLVLVSVPVVVVELVAVVVDTVVDVAVTVVVELEIVDVDVVPVDVVVVAVVVVVVVVVRMHVPHITGQRSCILSPTSLLVQYAAFSSWQLTGSGSPLHIGATHVVVPCSMEVTTKLCSTNPSSGNANGKVAVNFAKAAATSPCKRLGMSMASKDIGGSKSMDAISTIKRSELSTIKSLMAADSLV